MEVFNLDVPLVMVESLLIEHEGDVGLLIEGNGPYQVSLQVIDLQYAVGTTETILGDGLGDE